MADGPGFRTAIYCADCRHACKGCHNPQSWDFNAGKWMEVEELLSIIEADELSDVSFSGGDPFYQAEAFTELARRIKAETTKTIWCWTGFTIEEIQADPKLAQLIISQLGGPDIPAVGFGMGIERVLMLMNSEGIVIPEPPVLDVFVTFMGGNQQQAFKLVQQLRAAGVKADMDHVGRSLKAQFKYANKTGAPVTAVIGDDEAASGTVKLKRMSDGTEQTVGVKDAAEAIREMKE